MISAAEEHCAIRGGDVLDPISMGDHSAVNYNVLSDARPVKLLWMIVFSQNLVGRLGDMPLTESNSITDHPVSALQYHMQ